MKIRFVRDYTTKEASPQQYSDGQVVDLEERSARHFLTRGVAVELREAAAAAAAPRKEK